MFKNYYQTLFILIGIQASGKSTFCQRFLSHCNLISLDKLKTRKKEQDLLVQSLSEKKNCVIDNTNATAETRARYILPAKAQNYKIVGLYFRSSLEECLPRNENRTGNAKIPLKGILATAKKLQSPSYQEGFDKLYYIKIENKAFIIETWKIDL